MVSNTSSKRDRVLVIFPGALGDLICLVPALRILARQNRGCDLELMARGELANFAINRMGIVRAHSIDRRELSLLFSSAADATVEARGFFKVFSRVHSFFGYDDARLRQTLPQAAGGPVSFYPFRPEGGGHVAAAYIEGVGESLGRGGLPPDAAAIDMDDQDISDARSIIASQSAEPGQYFLLMPGSGSQTKNWPAESYLQLARHLRRATPVVTVLGPAEEHMEGMFSSLSPVKSPPLGTLAGLARLSELFVGNDSGTSHLAAAAGARGVVIFGPSDPLRWHPLGRVTVLRRMPLQALRWQEVAQVVTGLRGHAESER
jgi:heptosyltransferase-3